MGRASLGNPLIVKPEDVITAPEFTRCTEKQSSQYNNYCTSAHLNVFKKYFFLWVNIYTGLQLAIEHNFSINDLSRQKMEYTKRHSSHPTLTACYHVVVNEKCIFWNTDMADPANTSVHWAVKYLRFRIWLICLNRSRSLVCLQPPHLLWELVLFWEKH